MVTELVIKSKTAINFSSLMTSDNAGVLLTTLNHLLSDEHDKVTLKLGDDNIDYKALLLSTDEYSATEALIKLFNTLFSDQNVQLVRGDSEPEYFAAVCGNPARIEFAHGFFASALHELSHWCIAGAKRRQLNDFGYWYAADGRSQAQQRAFERVEIKPQAIECLFTLACLRPFQVSQDNLFANFDTSDSTFAYDVYAQAKAYIAEPQRLPIDAQILLQALLTHCTHPK